MKHINPPHKSGSTKNAFAGIPSAIRPVLCMMILILSMSGAMGSDLYAPPAYSQVTIVVANLQTGLLDKTIVGFNPNSTDTFSPVYDANKLFGSPGRQTLYTMNNGQYMSINTLPNEATVDTVLMGMAPGVNGTFSFSFSGLTSFDSSSFIFLEDKKTNVWHDLRKGDYTFTAATTDDWNRFLLHFTPPVVITGSNANCTPISTVNIEQPGITNWTYEFTDSLNAILDSGTLNQNQSATVQVPAGAYNLVLIDTSAYTTVKTIHVTTPPVLSAVNFTVSDSVVRVMQPITLTNAQLPNYDSTQNFEWNFGNGVTANGVDTTINYNKPGSYPIALTVTNTVGCTATQMHSITVTEAQATEIAQVNNANNLNIWSNSNKVYVDFTALQAADATVTIYNVLGQELSNDYVTASSLYEKEIDNSVSAYLIVKVLNNHQTTAKKVFISNSK